MSQQSVQHTTRVDSLNTTVLPDGSVLHAHIMKPFGRYTHSDVTGLLQWFGGPVQNTPKIYIVLWGFKKYGDPDGVAKYLEAYLKGVGGSKWLNTVTQYTDGSGPIKNNKNQLYKILVDNKTAVPSQPSDGAVQQEALLLAKKVGYDADASYVVSTPHGHNSPGFGSSYCAYHGSVSGPKGPVAYTNNPYMPDAGQNCGQNFVNQGQAGINDGVSIVEGHELAETQTDPEAGNGWLTPGGEEIGDLCAWQGLGDIKLSTGTFAVQPLYSDTQSGCVLSGP